MGNPKGAKKLNTVLYGWTTVTVESASFADIILFCIRSIFTMDNSLDYWILYSTYALVRFNVSRYFFYTSSFMSSFMALVKISIPLYVTFQIERILFNSLDLWM